MISETDIRLRLVGLHEQRLTLLEYMDMKADAEDFHGVADAAMDLRDLDAEVRALRWVLNDGAV